MVASDGRVDAGRIDPNITGIKVGEPVRAVDWSDLARLAMWVRARGRQLVAGHCPMTRLGAIAGSTATHYYRVRGYGPAIARVWVGVIQAVNSGSEYFCTATVQAGAAATSGSIIFGTGLGPRQPFIYIEDATTKGTATQDLTFTVSTTDGELLLVSLACWELPRAALARSADDLGVGLDSYFPRQPIYESTYLGPRGVANLIAGLSTSRIAMASFFHTSGVVTTSASFVSTTVAGIPIVPDKDRPSDTTRTVEAYAWAAVSVAGTTGEVQLRDAAGAVSSAVEIASTTYSHIGPLTKTFSCEDPDTTNGLRSGAYDTLFLDFRRKSGAGTVTVRGMNAYVSPV